MFSLLSRRAARPEQAPSSTQPVRRPPASTQSAHSRALGGRDLRTPKHRASLLSRLTLLATLAGLAGCGGGSRTPSTPTSGTTSATSKAATLKSNVKLLPQGKVQISGLTETAVTLAGDVPPLKAGDVIYGSDGGGLLRKVKSVTQTGTTAVVQTDTASLEEVFQEAHIDSDRVLDASLHPVFTSAQPGVTFSYGPLSKKAQALLAGAQKPGGRGAKITRDDLFANHLQVNFGPWNVDLPGGKMVVDGVTTLDYGIRTAFDFSGGQAQHLRFTPHVTPQVALHITGDIKAGDSQTYTKDLGTLSTDAIRIPVAGLPLTINISPKIRVYATLQWNAEGHLEVIVTAGFTAEAGVEYTREAGWQTITTLTPTPDTGIRFVNSRAKAHIDVTPLNIELSLGIQDSLGIARLAPYCNLQLPHAIGDARAQSSPAGYVANVYADFVANAGFFGDIFSHRVADYQFPAFSFWHTDFPPQYTSGATGILYLVGGKSADAIHLMNPDGTNQHAVPINVPNKPSGVVEYASLSADNTRIVFVYTTSTNGTITDNLYTCNVTGGDIKQLTNLAGVPSAKYLSSANTPVWSPDGTKIAFVYNSGSGQEIDTVSAQNGPSTPTQVLGSRYVTGGIETGIAWSPDGTRITFATHNTDYTRRALMELNLDNSAFSPVLDDGQTLPVSPTYSPDGKIVAFTNEADGNIYSVPTNTVNSHPKQLTFRGDSGFPSFSPDSAQIIYETRQSTPTPQFAVVTVDGTPSSLLKQPVTGSFPSWR